MVKKNVKKSHNKHHKEGKEITMICNTAFNANLKTKTKRVQFVDDVGGHESPSPSKVRNIVGLFEGEK